MDDMDFERRRELRRQKREEMRLEAERMARNDDEEEEAARERRRRARQERMKSRDSEESSGPPDGPHVTNSHSVTETVSVSSMGGGGGDEEEEQALMDRMAKREERRQRRVKDAVDRQRELDPTVATETNNNDDDAGGEEEERPSSWRGGRHRDNDEEAETYGGRREQEEEQEEAPLPADEEEEQEQVGEEEVGQKGVEPEEEPPRRSYLREQESTEEPAKTLPEERTEDHTPHVGEDDNSNQGESARSEAEGNAMASEEVEADELVDNSMSHDKARTPSGDEQEDNEVSELLRRQNGLDVANERGGAREERERKQNGGLYEETPPPKQHRQPERTFSRGSVRSPDPAASPPAAGGPEDVQDGGLEAERKLEELKRRRDDAESEEFERMRQRQQEAEVELDELKRRREGRRKVLEEEERQRKQEEAERKAREEDEKRKMKEEIEKRRAEAAEKRQKVEDDGDGEGQPFKCVSPRGSSLKIGERAEFLNKSAQKSTVKASHSPLVSKIDNRLEQYTSAAQRENKESRSPRSGAVDLPMVTDGVRNIKSMWEKGNVFSSPGGGGTPYKEAAVMKIGVAGRINDWLNKTPEGGKTPAGGRPADLKPVDVTNKRSLWENKGASPAKATGRGEAKSVTNGMGH